MASRSCGEDPPYRTHRQGDSLKLHRGKGLKTVCIAAHYTNVDRGEGVPIFRRDDIYRFGGDNFDDPTTNVYDVAP
jgi:hypothetical protein